MEIGIGLGRDGFWFCDFYVSPLQPAGEEARGSFAEVAGVPVLFVGFDQVHSLGKAEDSVGALGLAKGVPGSGDGNEIVRCGQDKGRSGGPEDGEVRVVKAFPDLGEEDLLGIAGAGAFVLFDQSRHETAGRRGFDPGIESHEEGGHVSAAGVAGAAEAAGIDFGPGGEVIEGAQAVVDHVSRETSAEQDGCAPEDLVLAGGLEEPGSRFVEELFTLSLADGIVAQNGESVSNK